jgi:hypothetical protein
LKTAVVGKDREVYPIRKEVAPTGIEWLALKAEAATKGSQGAAVKKRAIIKELEGESLRKGRTGGDGMKKRTNAKK